MKHCQAQSGRTKFSEIIVSLKAMSLLSLATNTSVVYREIIDSLYFVENICQISKYLIIILNHNNPSVVLLGKRSIPWRLNRRCALSRQPLHYGHYQKHLTILPIFSHRIPKLTARLNKMNNFSSSTKTFSNKVRFFYYEFMAVENTVPSGMLAATALIRTWCQQFSSPLPLNCHVSINSIVPT